MKPIFKQVWDAARPNLKRRLRESFDDGGLRQQIRGSYGNLLTRAKERLRNPGTFPASFDELQLVWGVSDEEIPTTVRNLRIHSALLCTCATLSVVGGYSNLYAHNLVYAGTYLVVGCGLVYGALTLWWRASILKRRQAISFRQWLLGDGK